MLIAIAVAIVIIKEKYCNQTASGNVPNAYWNRDNRQANLNRNDPDNRNSDDGARSAVKDYVFKDFNQPPSILPISRILLCVWKIFVSLAIFSSRKRRSFKVEISKWLLALIRYGDFKGLGAFLAIINSCKSDKMLFSKLCSRPYRHLFSR